MCKGIEIHSKHFIYIQIVVTLAGGSSDTDFKSSVILKGRKMEFATQSSSNSYFIRFTFV